MYTLMIPLGYWQLVQGRISSSDNDEIAQLYSVVLEGLLLLTSWKCSVLLFVSNKYQVNRCA